MPRPLNKRREEEEGEIASETRAERERTVGRITEGKQRGDKGKRRDGRVASLGQARHTKP